MTNEQKILTNLRGKGHRFSIGANGIEIVPALKDSLMDQLKPYLNGITKELAYEQLHPNADQDRALKGVLDAIGANTVVAITGAAGTGKSYSMASLVKQLPDDLNYVVTAPTHKAVSVLHANGVDHALTIKAATQRPIWTESRTRLLNFLEGNGDLPTCFVFSKSVIKHAKEITRSHSAEDGLRTMGLSAFDERLFQGWALRDEAYDLIIVDEASMMSGDELTKLRSITDTLILIGDPNQLQPVRSKSKMSLAYANATYRLSKVRRQANDSGVLDLAYAVLKGSRTPSQLLAFASNLDHVRVVDHFPKDALWKVPALCWKNESRIQIYQQWRNVCDLPKEKLVNGEPLICTGSKEHDLYINGSRWWVSKSGWSKREIELFSDFDSTTHHVIASVSEGQEFKGGVGVPLFKNGHGGAFFRHGAAITIHQSQGGQYPAALVAWPDIVAAYHMYDKPDDQGLRLWQRLAYVAITRAEQKCFLCTSLEVE